MSTIKEQLLRLVSDTTTLAERVCSLEADLAVMSEKLIEHVGWMEREGDYQKKRFDKLMLNAQEQLVAAVHGPLVKRYEAIEGLMASRQGQYLDFVNKITNQIRALEDSEKDKDVMHELVNYVRSAGTGDDVPWTWNCRCGISNDYYLGSYAEVKGDFQEHLENS